MLHGMKLTLRSAQVTHVGLVRKNNEDTAYAGSRLAAVADGMGGMPAGELASDIVMSALAPLDTPKDPKDAAGALREALDKANEQIRTTTESDASQDGMGTTVTSLLLSGDTITLVHVGDSRCYLRRDGTITQLTKDDTFVQSLVDQGVLTPAEARAHPRRSIVTQAVQGEELVPEVAQMTVQPGDRFLVCSDGLSDWVSEDSIAETLASVEDPDLCAGRLVDLALVAGAPDNVTVVVADVVKA
jgi:serine/threonine protein phosphatase PrpC